MIRQAISCDICGAEKKQTNHWFVVYEQGGELRVGGWTSRNRLRPNSKHLCGQTCLHKLVDDFVARTLAARQQMPVSEDTPLPQAEATDTSLTSAAAYDEFESSARLIPSPASLPEPIPVVRMQSEVVALPVRPVSEPLPAAAAETGPRYGSRSWRAEAWERERQRESHGGENRVELPVHRRLRG